MHSNLALAATLVIIFSTGVLVGTFWSVEATKDDAVATGYMAHNGHTYQVTGIRPRGE